MQKRNKYEKQQKHLKYSAWIEDDNDFSAESFDEEDPEPTRDVSGRSKTKSNHKRIEDIKDWNNIPSFSSFGIRENDGFLKGIKVPLETIIGREIILLDYRINKSKYPDKNTNKPSECLRIQFVYPNDIPGQEKIVFTGSKILIDMIRQAEEMDCQFPFKTTIRRESNYFKFG